MFESSLKYRAATAPDRPVMETEKGNVTFAQLDAAVHRFTRVLLEAGIVAGQTVLVSDSRPFVHWALLFALDLIGCVSVSEDAHHRASKVVTFDLVISEHAADFGSIMVINTNQDWLDAALAAAPWTNKSRRTAPDDNVRIVLTSGTTGLPQQILFTRGMIDAQIANLCVDILRPSARMMSTMGIDSLGGYLVSHAVWNTGGSVLYGSSPVETMLALEPDFMLMAPIQLQYLLARLPADAARRDHLRIAVGGSAMPRRLLKAVNERLTNDVAIGYGSTEAGYITGGAAALSFSQPGASGYVLPGSDLEIVDSEGLELPAGEIGTVRVRSLGSASGYLVDKAEASGALFKDGWFYPGDLGSLRADGLFVLEGREGDVLNLGGVKLSAWTIEESVLENTSVVEAAAFTLPGELGLPALYVAAVLAEGRVPQQVAESLAQSVSAPFKLVALPSIPRNPMGKVLRQELRVAVGKQLGLLDN